MFLGYVIRKNEYHDSVFLMRAAKGIAEQKGILQAMLLMGTEKNRALLVEIGFRAAEIATATPNDLILAVEAADEESLQGVLGKLDQWLAVKQSGGSAAAARNIDEALTREPLANLAVISVPGEYAAREAQLALERGLNVFLFSDNVPLESERSLKTYASERGLIVMGPDCGTAIIGGVGIGFANVVRRGPIGAIGASGTGLQEFTTLVHHAGSGISQAIGTGGRDLADELGGISMISSLDALEADSETKVIALISKPPGQAALVNLTRRINRCRKPVIACFLGWKKELAPNDFQCRMADTLDEAAELAVHAAAGNFPPSLRADGARLEALAARERGLMNSDQKYIRGIFAGGTFCYQAQQILKDAGIAAYSNSPIVGNFKLPVPQMSREHSLVDMGADEFTTGRPHPMIDSRFRQERLLAEGQDPQTALILLDFHLGFNASADPVGELAPVIAEVKQAARKRGGHLSVVASVCGTDEDEQGLRRQVARLEDKGVIVLASAAQAARFAALVAVKIKEASHDR